MAKLPLNGKRSKFIQGYYTPKNREKYVGELPVVCRSSWEIAFCRFADSHPSVISWASEALKIPYFNPFTQKICNYIPDFFVVYVDRAGKTHREIIEIKPENHTTNESAKNNYDKASVFLNAHKWQAAEAFCKNNGLVFRVLNKKDIFGLK